MGGRLGATAQRTQPQLVEVAPSQPRLAPAPELSPTPVTIDVPALRSRVSAFIQGHFGRGNKINPLLSPEQLMRCSSLIDEYHSSWPQVRRAEQWMLWSGGLISVPVIGVIFTKLREKFHGDAQSVFLLLTPVVVPFAAFMVFHSRADRYFKLGEIIQKQCLSEDSEARSASQEGGASAWRHVFAALDHNAVVGDEFPALDLPVTVGGEEFLDEVPVHVSLAGAAILAGAVALVTASFFVPWEVVLPGVSLPEMTTAAPALAL